MESSILTTIFLPLALAIIMYTMGLTLTVQDFRRIFIYPKAVLLGLFNQLIILPIVGFIIATIFPLQPELAVGVMILALCPGGATSNLITHLSKADVALSVTLTAFSSIIVVFTIPFFVNFSMAHFMGAATYQHLPILGTTIKVLTITIIPVLLGMFTKARFPMFTRKLYGPINGISVIFFVLIVLGAVLKQKENIVAFFIQAGPAALTLNVATMLIGFVVAKLFKLNAKQSTTISLETGLQNGTLAITIASSTLLLNNETMAITPAIYSLIMFFTAGIVIFIARGQFKDSKIIT